MKFIKPIFLLIPGMALLTRGPRFAVSALLGLTLAFSILIEVTHFKAKGAGPEAIRAEIGQLEATCQTAYAAQSEQEDIYISRLAQSNTYRCQPYSLGDLVLALGAPDVVGCVHYSKPKNEPIVWMRFIFARGRIEAIVMLPGDIQRLRPEDRVRTLVIYNHEGDMSSVDTTPWRGFAALTVYRTCPERQTRTLDKTAPQDWVPICNCS